MAENEKDEEVIGRIALLHKGSGGERSRPKKRRKS